MGPEDCVGRRLTGIASRSPGPTCLVSLLVQDCVAQRSSDGMRNDRCETKADIYTAGSHKAL
jgi:hypothetical protein